MILYKTGKYSQRKINTKNKHCMVLGLTTLSGKPVMCYILFAGKKENPFFKTGLNLAAEIIGDTEDEDFLE